jgi:dTDP-4-dehydrorhamnose 3,5-epimerase-like enzyme
MTIPTAYVATAAGHPRIEGVKVKPLRLIPDERGWLLEILRSDDADLFSQFGQVYVSATYPGVVKAWHYHQIQIDNFACIAGMVKLVLVDTRPDSPTRNAVNEFSSSSAHRIRSSCRCRISCTTAGSASARKRRSW